MSNDQIVQNMPESGRYIETIRAFLAFNEHVTIQPILNQDSWNSRIGGWRLWVES